jgi:membrane protease YdiL (CAAX protease family)
LGELPKGCGVPDISSYLIFASATKHPGLSTYVSVATLLLSGSLFFLKGKLRNFCAMLLLLSCTVASVYFFQQMIQRQERMPGLQSRIAEQRAESALKIQSTINVGVAMFYERFAGLKDDGGKQHHPLDLSNKAISSYCRAAETALKDALKADPASAALRAKLVVVLSVGGRHPELSRSTCNSLKESKVESERQLGDALDAVYFREENDRSSEDIGREVKLLQSQVPRGWYQDNLLLAVYKSGNDSKAYDSFARGVEERYFRTFCLSIGALVFGALACFVGLVVIIIQLGSLARKDSVDETPSEKMGLDLSSRTVYAVLAGWITSQVIIAEGLKLLPAGMLSLGGNPMGIAVFSLVSYLVTMLPALLLIYFVALRPKGLSPISALKLRFATRKLGPVRLVVVGILSWCAIIPLVILGAAVSAALGSQGSDNPVLPQIALIAGSGNTLAVFLIFFNVAVLAPFCEEIIFRGFLYSSLRTRIGIFPAILASSLIFAGIHFDRGGALMLLALGPVLALAFERTRSLVPAMVAHGLWNAGSFAFTLSLFAS